MHRRLACLSLIPFLLSSAFAAPPSLGGCQVLPADHIFNTRIDSLPVHPQSAAYLATISSSARKLHLDLGVSEDMRSSEYYGIPYNLMAGKSASWQPVYYKDGYPDESDCAKQDHSVAQPCVNTASQPLLPIPAAPLVEGGIETNQANYGDHHILTIDTDSCMLWESYHSYPHAGGGWDIWSSAAFDLRSNTLRPAGWTSADAAGFPILPLLLRADEANSGEINHALRFTIQSSKIRAAYVWPARHLTSNGGSSASKPAMGQLFRLKADYPVPDSTPTQAKAILTALKRYGMYIADGGSDMYIQGEPSAKWADATFSVVQAVPHTAFEAVDLAPIMARSGFNADSAAVPAAAGAFSITPQQAGSASSLSLGVDVTVASGDAGKAGAIYIAALLPTGAVYSLTSAGWQPVQNLALLPFANVSLGKHSVPITSQLNVSAYKGLQIYAGYGQSLGDLIQGSKYALLYSVPSN